MSYAELVFISAKTGQRLPKIFDVLDMVIENHALRVQTGVLNEILTEAVAMKQPPSDKGKRLKLYYITQVSVKPPTFVVFINDRQLMHFSYTRYLENQIRNTFGFRGTLTGSEAGLTNAVNNALADAGMTINDIDAVFGFARSEEHTLNSSHRSQSRMPSSA